MKCKRLSEQGKSLLMLLYSPMMKLCSMGKSPHSQNAKNPSDTLCFWNARSYIQTWAVFKIFCSSPGGKKYASRGQKSYESKRYRDLKVSIQQNEAANDIWKHNTSASILISTFEYISAFPSVGIKCHCLEVPPVGCKEKESKPAEGESSTNQTGFGEKHTTSYRFIAKWLMLRKWNKVKQH